MMSVTFICVLVEGYKLVKCKGSIISVSIVTSHAVYSRGIIILRGLLTHQEEWEQDNGGHATLSASDYIHKTELHSVGFTKRKKKGINTALFGVLKCRKHCSV